MKKLALLSLLSLSSFAFADGSFSLKEKLGAEIGGLYLSQSGGGNTTTVLPMINLKVLERGTFKLNAQAGATAYLDDSSDDRFFVGVARVNPTILIEKTQMSLEGLFGFQYWDEGKKINLDLGARLNYNILDLSKKYLDEAFVGVGIITHSETATYFTLGVKKWF
jgi:hypothetical protein